MTIDIPFPELEAFILKAYDKPVQIKSREKDTVEVHYIATVTLSLINVMPHGLILGYKTNGLVAMMIKGMRGKIREQLDRLPFLQWDEKNDQVTVDLDQLPAAKVLLSHLEIANLSFDNDHAILEMRPY